MANIITTLKDKTKTNNLIPRTQIQAICDSNGNYLDNNLSASDINTLKGGGMAKTEGNFAQIEVSPSEHAYVEGQFLVYNGILYKVIDDIAVNDTLIIDTNIESTTVGSEINNIDSEISDINTAITNISALENTTNGFDSSTVPTWTSGTTYAIGAVVKYNGKYYRNKDANPHSSWHDEYFDEISDLANTKAISDFGTYSTSQEVVIGKFNGANLYRKVFTGTKSTPHAENFSFGSINNTKIKKIEGSCVTHVGSVYTPYYYTSEDFFRIWAGSDGLWLMGGSSYPPTPYTWTVEITYTH